MLDAKHKRSSVEVTDNLATAARIRNLRLALEGSSIRSISRITACRSTRFTKLLEDASGVCAAYHNAPVRGVGTKRVQCDEFGSFCNDRRTLQPARLRRKRLATCNLVQS